ncbi:hypothetical protein HHK36_016107 [Tetracentron sinense]|uniref:Trichome birefringence-like C-terminal domain-containing protein n=1 Tax=Tetracentron sinense TaxID=13715 RepID=A0A834Z0T2_TETSI|nr:hypothetical protein HHK36_016107 [Tetracentron sinense]
MANKQHIVPGTWGIRNSFHSLIGLLGIVLVVSTVYLRGKRECLADYQSSGDMLSRCNLFSGKWVFDNTSHPLYSERQCSFMSDQLACEKFGRNDLGYQNWRFNATALLEKLRGKRLVFVGDSLNRGQWVSMVCLVESSMPSTAMSMHTNGSLITIKATVESNSDDPVNHRLPERIVRVQAIEKHARHWTDADILVFNSYLWWRRPKMMALWGSFESSDGIYKEVEMLRIYEMALHTWSDWLEVHVNRTRTQLFFVSMSPTHFWGGEWGMGSGRNCYNETEPIRKEGHWGRDSDPKMMRVVEAAIDGLKHRGLNVQMLNITQLSEYRKEGHPSIYRKQWEALTEKQLLNPSSYSDCIHWCLPGVPDAWNELLYAYILQS